MKSSVGIAERGAPGQSGSEDDLRTITFVSPVPGFPGLRRFVLTGLDDTGDEPADQAADQAAEGADGAVPRPESVLYELRSVERPEIRFMIATAYAFFPDYDVELDDQICDNLDLTDAADALIMVILTVGDDATSITANLLAPVIINGRNRSAAQVILPGAEWPVRARLG